MGFHELTMKHTICFIISHRGTALEMLPVIAAVDSQTQYCSRVLITKHAAETIPVLEKNNIEYMVLHTEHLSRFVHHIPFVRTVVRACFMVSLAHKILVGMNAAALVMGNEHRLWWETAFIKAANKFGIPSLILPHGLYLASGVCVERSRSPCYEKDYVINSWLKKLIAYFFPLWVFSYRGKRIFYYPWPSALAAWCTGLMPPSPWDLRGFRGTLLAAESGYAKNLYIRQGISEEQVIITGRPSLDVTAALVSDEQMRMLRHKYHVRDEDRIVLCSLPDLAEHRLLSWDDHWEEIEFLLHTFQSLKGAKILISIHPLCDPEKYQAIAYKYDAQIIDERVYEIQPICDVYVSMISSTVIQARAWNKPVVVADFYNLGISLYENECGIVLIRTKSALLSALQKALNLPKQGGINTYWALLDGGNTIRVLKTLHNLIMKRS